jgi:hypothetical protein
MTLCGPSSRMMFATLANAARQDSFPSSIKHEGDDGRASLFSHGDGSLVESCGNLF